MSHNWMTAQQISDTCTQASHTTRKSYKGMFTVNCTSSSVNVSYVLTADASSSSLLTVYPLPENGVHRR